MKEDKLGTLSMELSVEVLNLVKELREKKENIISNQIGRSATSVCANIAESKYGQSRADFIAKLEIALKEASETGSRRGIIRTRFGNTNFRYNFVKILGNMFNISCVFSSFYHKICYF